MLTGRIIAIVGLALLPIGYSFVSVAREAVSIVLGIAAYVLGSRQLGTATIVLAVVVVLFSLLTQQYPGGPSL